MAKRKQIVWHPDFLLGSALEDSGDIVGAIHAYRKAAKKGDTSSQNNLANLLDDKPGPARQREAIYWYKRAVRGGHVTAASNLAVHYGNLGQLRWQLHWMRVAKRMGDRDIVADTFDRAHDLRKRGDLQKSLCYFQAAAAMGHVRAKKGIPALKQRLERELTQG